MASEPSSTSPAGLLSDPDRLLTNQELSEITSVPLRSIYQWSTTGGGPRRIRVGRYVRYRASDVREWLDSQYVD